MASVTSRPATRPSVSALAGRVRRLPLPFVLVLVIAAIHGGAWAVAQAPLGGPDEANHVAYAQHLAEAGTGPYQGTGARTYSEELQLLLDRLQLGPLTGHRDARPLYSRLGDVRKEMDRLPSAQRGAASGPNAVANNPPLYYAYAALAYRLSPDTNLLSRILVMRLATVLLFVALVAMTWLLAAELTSRMWVKTLAAGMVALQPKVASIAGIVNPDMLLATLSTASILAAVRLVRHGPQPGIVVGLGTVGGLTTLAHGRGFFVLFLLAVTALVAWWRWRPARGALLRSLALGAAPLLACLVGGYLYTRSHAVLGAFGGEVTQATEQHLSVSEFLSYVWQFYFGDLRSLTPMIGPPYGFRQVWIDSFYGSFGGLDVDYAPRVYDVLQVASVAGILLLLAVVVRRWEAVRPRLPIVVVLLAALIGMLGLLHVASYRDLQVSDDPLITGRYLFPCIALYGLATAFVARSLPPRIGPAFGALLLALSTLLAVGGLADSVVRFHA
jgi:4-amino-4-deoxy-L-arabinose transferase-like glycosyltransferase